MDSCNLTLPRHQRQLLNDDPAINSTLQNHRHSLLIDREREIERVTKRKKMEKGSVMVTEEMNNSHAFCFPYLGSNLQSLKPQTILNK
ncbi:hypothetical protein Lal_00049805, partial [Lupinus albus]